MSLLAALVLLANHLYMPSPAAAMTEEEAVIESILMQRAASNRALAEKDFDAFQQILDADYQITRGNGGFGDADEAAGMVRELFASKPYTLYVRTPAAVEVGSSGQRAFESGSWVGTTEPEGGRRLGGNYSAYWRRVDGAWRIHAELFVTLFCEGTGCD